MIEVNDMAKYRVHLYKIKYGVKDNIGKFDFKNRSAAISFAKSKTSGYGHKFYSLKVQYKITKVKK